MNPAQAFIDALATELTQTFGPLKYTVEVREPVEGELKATSDARQIFITTEGIEFLEGIADLGESTRVNLPVMVACVMKRPSTPVLSAQTLKRRFTLVQAVQRVCRDFAQIHSEALLKPMQEAPSLIEGYFVSITGVEIEFDLSAQGDT